MVSPKIVTTIGEFVSFVLGPLMVIICVVFVYSFNVGGINIGKCVYYYALLSIVCYIISTFARGIFLGMNNEINWDNPNENIKLLHIWVVFDVIQSELWHLGNAFGYMLFLNRLNHGFNNSEYALSNRIYNIILVFIILYIGSALCNIPALLEYKLEQPLIKNSRIDRVFFWVYKFVPTVLDLIVSTVLLIMFIKKLSLVTKNLSILELQVSLNNDVEMESRSDDTKLNEISNKKNILFDVMTKVFILSTIMIISTQIVLIMASLLVIINGIPNEDEYYTITGGYMNMRLFRSFDCFIGVICVFLFFEFTQYYYQYCCSSIHSCIKKCFINCMDNVNPNSINNEYKSI